MPADFPEIALRQILSQSKVAAMTKLVEVFHDEAYIYQVTQLMNTGDLQSFMELRKVGHLTEFELMQYTKGILTALDHIH